VRLRITKMRSLHQSAFRHGVSAEDIEHVLKHPMRVIPQDDGTRVYLGPARNAELLEVITLVRVDNSEIAVHAMKMRRKYATLVPSE